MALKAYIPNGLTLLNLLCGTVAVVFAVNNNFILTSVFVFLGVFFDFFDGFLARKLNVQSELGVQLDSLADMVTSGLVPGVVMFKLLTLTATAPDFISLSDSWNSSLNANTIRLAPFALVGFVITLGSAYRLAKFNIDEDQQTYFKGLPTPANALLILSLPLIVEYNNSDMFNTIIINKWFLILVSFLSAYLLNSNIKLFALKFKDWSFKNNAVRYIFLAMAVVLLVVFKFAAIPLIIVFYIISSLFSN